MLGTDDGIEVVPDPTEVLPHDAQIVLIGTAEAEERFLERYGRETVDRRGARA